MAKYPKVKNWTWLQIAREFRMGCCDCGLVHVFQFRIRGRKIQLRAKRDNRATGQVRRHKK